MGRPSKPRYRANRKVWVCTVAGRYHTLAHGRENKAEALKAFHRLMAEAEKPKTAEAGAVSLHNVDEDSLWTVATVHLPLLADLLEGGAAPCSPKLAPAATTRR